MTAPIIAEPSLDYTRNEQSLLDGVLDGGGIDASLLDIEPEIQARIAAMPMLNWKTAHVRERLIRS